MPKDGSAHRELVGRFAVALLLASATAGATVIVASSPDRTDFAPVVAAQPDGGWAVCWEATAPGSLGQIWLRLLDPSGAPRGPARVVDTGVLALALRGPRLAVAASGEVLVAYRRERYNYSALAVQRFAADGQPLDGTASALVSAGPTEIGRHDVVALPGGGWLLVYGFAPQDGSVPASIQALELGESGTATSPAMTISPNDGAARSEPTLARRPDGLLVSWIRTPPHGTGPPSPSVHVGRRLDGHGGPIESETPIRLDDATASSDRLPAVASAGNAEGRAAWFAVEETTHAVTLRSRRMLDGSPLGNVVELRTLKSAAEPSLSSLAADERGRFLVSWIEPNPADPGGGYQPGWQLFGRGATPLGPAHALPATAGVGSASPGVAMQGSGAWAVVWAGPSAGGQSAIYADLGVLANDCVASETALCLTGGRFRVEATWTDHTGRQGAGHAMPMTGETGAFWFFSPGNVELVVKVLDACSYAPFRDYWVFASGLTDVEVDLAATDTITGEQWSYSNPRGTAFPPVQDTSALHVCP